MPPTKHSRRLQAVARQLSARDARASAAAAGNSSLAVAATRARRTLSEEQLLRFHSDGFLIVRKLLSTFEIMALSELVDAIASGSVPSVPPEKVQPDPPHADVPPELGRTATTGVRKMYDLTLHSEEMLAHARHPAIVDVIEDLLGTPDLKLYGDQLFPKPVFDAGWHQDLFRGVIPSEVISAWTAIDAATATNGALHYIPGSHRWGPIDEIGGPPFWLSAGNNPSNNKSGRESLPRGAVAARDDAQADDAWRRPVSFELEPGDVAFHHCLTLHTSGHVVNPATAGVPLPRRRGYSVHYMRASSMIQSAGAKQIGNGNPLTGQSGGGGGGGYMQIRGRSFEGRV